MNDKDLIEELCSVPPSTFTQPINQDSTIDLYYANLHSTSISNLSPLAAIIETPTTPNLLFSASNIGEVKVCLVCKSAI